MPLQANNPQVTLEGFRKPFLISPACLMLSQSF